jgi:hypothetical protein
MVSVIMLIVIILSFIMLGVIYAQCQLWQVSQVGKRYMVSVIVPNVVVMNAIAPWEDLQANTYL